MLPVQQEPPPNTPDVWRPVTFQGIEELIQGLDEAYQQESRIQIVVVVFWVNLGWTTEGIRKKPWPQPHKMPPCKPKLLRTYWKHIYCKTYHVATHLLYYIRLDDLLFGPWITKLVLSSSPNSLDSLARTKNWWCAWNGRRTGCWGVDHWTRVKR